MPEIVPEISPKSEVSATEKLETSQKTVQESLEKNPQYQQSSANDVESVQKHFGSAFSPTAAKEEAEKFVGNMNDEMLEQMFKPDFKPEALESIIPKSISDKELRTSLLKGLKERAQLTVPILAKAATYADDKPLIEQYVPQLPSKQQEGVLTETNRPGTIIDDYAEKKDIDKWTAQVELLKDKDFQKLKELADQGKWDEKLEIKLRKKLGLTVNRDEINQHMAERFESSGKLFLEAGVSSSVIENAGKRLIEMGNNYIVPALTSLTGFFDDAVVGKAALFLTQKNFEAMQKGLNEERERIREYLGKLLGKVGAKEIDDWAETKAKEGVTAEDLRNDGTKSGKEMNELIDGVVADEKKRVAAVLRTHLATVPVDVLRGSLALIPDDIREALKSGSKSDLAERLRKDLKLGDIIPRPKKRA